MEEPRYLQRLNIPFVEEAFPRNELADCYLDRYGFLFADPNYLNEPPYDDLIRALWQEYSQILLQKGLEELYQIARHLRSVQTQLASNGLQIMDVKMPSWRLLDRALPSVNLPNELIERRARQLEHKMETSWDAAESCHLRIIDINQRFLVLNALSWNYVMNGTVGAYDDLSSGPRPTPARNLVLSERKKTLIWQDKDCEEHLVNLLCDYGFLTNSPNSSPPYTWASDRTQEQLAYLVFLLKENNLIVSGRHWKHASNTFVDEAGRYSFSSDDLRKVAGNKYFSAGGACSTRSDELDAIVQSAASDIGT